MIGCAALPKSKGYKGLLLLSPQARKQRMQRERLTPTALPLACCRRKNLALAAMLLLLLQVKTPSRLQGRTEDLSLEDWISILLRGLELVQFTNSFLSGRTLQHG